MKDSLPANMSTRAGQAPGPLRPIPIHLARPPGLDALRFRLPLSLEKSTRPNPPLWNPALDLRSTPRESVSTSETNLSKKSNLANPRSLPSASTSSSPVSPGDARLLPARLSEATMKDVKFSKSFTTSQPGSIKAPPMIGALIYEQLHRHCPSSLENPLAVLASKGLFPSLLGVQDHIMSSPAHQVTTTHPNISMTLSERHMTLQSALSFAQSRAVMERLNSSHPQDSLVTLGHFQQPHSLHLHQSQQTPQQNAASTQQLAIPNPRQSSAPSERPVSLHSAFTHAHSRALLERISNNPILSPAISIDNTVAHGYGRKLFPCPQCRYTTDRRNNLKRHMLTMHQTSTKMLECCGILFNTKASLREHAMIFHYHGYTCYFCGRRFCRKALLKRHLSVHNGQKDFVCNVCDYATSHKSNLERHRKVHSRQDDGKDGEDRQRYHDDDAQHYHDDVKSNGSEALSHDDVSSDDLSVCSDFDDDIDVEINVHSD